MFALRAGRVFDGRSLRGAGAIVVDGERIHAIEPVAPGGVETLDLGADVTLLPGLVDTHQHLCFSCVGTLEEQVTPCSDEQLTERAVANARRALAAGVTTIRDLGDRGWVTAALRDDPSLPTIQTAGAPLTRTDGHCWYLGGGCDSTAELRRALAERVERGVDVIKVMATGGMLTAGAYPVWTTQFPPEDLRLIVETAHAAGLPVAAHCHGNVGIAAALDAGVDSIEHCSFVDDDGVVRPAPGLLERLAASGVAVSATLGRLPDVPLPDFVVANVGRLIDVRVRLHELGAIVVTGTDAGINLGKPHDVLPYALKDYVDAGQEVVAGLTAITSTAAAAIGLADRKGRLDPGFDADVLAVRGDPTTDPGALLDVVGVWRAGRRVDSAA